MGATAAHVFCTFSFTKGTSTLFYHIYTFHYRFYQIRQYGEAELAERGSTPLEEVRKEVFSRIANFTDPIRKKIHDSGNKLQNAVETAEQSMRLLEDTAKHDFSSSVEEVVEKTKEDLDEAVDAARKDD